MLSAAAKPTLKKPTALTDKLAAMGLRSELDLVLHLPLRYEDLSAVDAIIDAPHGRPVQVEGVVTNVDVQYRPRRQLVARLTDDSGEIFLRFINFYPSQVAQLQGEPTVRAYGELRHGFFGTEMVHPRINRADNKTLTDTLTPVYPTTASVSQAVLRKRIAQALSTVSLPEILPVHWVSRLRMPSLQQALNLLHNPPADQPTMPLQERSHPAWQRVKFDELLAQQLSLKQAHKQRELLAAPSLGNIKPNGWVAQFLAALPFQLTGAQQRVWGDIANDLALPHPMNRLLQGDVGSGKTVVAALACLHAIDHGLQAALMAPTEILAEQHYQRLRGWLEPLGLRIVWLTGSLAKKAKETAQASVAAGECDLMIGTHALIQSAVNFARLGVVVVDEQHRFGVAQRLRLRDQGFDDHRGRTQPHLLMMSATPIPRTLAMTYLADLDVSVIDELPPGRSPIQTTVMAGAKRGELVARVAAWLAQGKQAYWVCPLIDESEFLQAQTANETHALLSEALNPYAVGLVHGQMKTLDKAAAMAAFVRRETALLVATTVIEVGVDVPNASLMVIENAERFGLAQLHQLRGRVGRGSQQSVCVLLYGDKVSQVGRERLNVMRGSTDGFYIAQKDLELRGPGELLGAQQSGLGLLRFADAQADEAWIKIAQDCAEDLLSHHADAAQAMLDRWLANREQYLNA
jgi:ATP-dependent DNA helicase RecG